MKINTILQTSATEEVLFSIEYVLSDLEKEWFIKNQIGTYSIESNGQIMIIELEQIVQLHFDILRLLPRVYLNEKIEWTLMEHESTTLIFEPVDQYNINIKIKHNGIQNKLINCNILEFITAAYNHSKDFFKSMEIIFNEKFDHLTPIYDQINKLLENKSG